MQDRPLVSCIVIFLNAERFLDEAIQSVFAQTYDSWELLLVDDGSVDGSSSLAKKCAELHPDRVRYLTHPNRANRGMSASRNLGISHARGKYLAFLDSDDVWLPRKLERQVHLLESDPQAAMVYGATEWWYSWSGKPEDEGRDFVQQIGIEPDRTYEPPSLFEPLFCKENGSIPCTCSLLVERQAVEKIGGFEESFRGMYEDQAFYAKLALSVPIHATNECYDRYRQHPESTSAIVEETGTHREFRLRFLAWLSEHLENLGIDDPRMLSELRRAHERAKNGQPSRVHERVKMVASQASAVPVKFARKVVPPPIRNWLLSKVKRHEYIPPTGWARLGSLRRVSPLSREWGYDRGLPVDRYYIERFLAANSADVHGRVLEILDDAYTRRYGESRVTRSDVLHAEPGNPKATIVGDLTCADHIPTEVFDCVILTQTLQLIYDVPAALRTIYRILKPGGVLLATIPGISPISRYDMDRWGHYWAFTTKSAERLFSEVFPADGIEIEAHGNVLAGISVLSGLAAEELSRDELDYVDPDYQVIITVRAIKPAFYE